MTNPILVNKLKRDYPSEMEVDILRKKLIAIEAQNVFLRNMYDKLIKKFAANTWKSNGNNERGIFVTIIRNNRKIALTPDELEEAYYKQQHIFYLTDAKNQFDNFVCDDDSYDPAFLASLRNNDFFFEQIVERFDCKYSSDISDNEMWDDAIRYVLNKISHCRE